MIPVFSEGKGSTIFLYLSMLTVTQKYLTQSKYTKKTETNDARYGSGFRDHLQLNACIGLKQTLIDKESKSILA